MPPRFEPPSPRSPRRLRSRRGSSGEPRSLGGEARCWPLADEVSPRPGGTVERSNTIDRRRRRRRNRIRRVKVAVAAALADALRDVRGRRRGRADDAETARGAPPPPRRTSSFVTRRANERRRTPRVAARCPALLRGVDADADRRDGSSSGAAVVARSRGVTALLPSVGVGVLRARRSFRRDRRRRSDEASTLAAVARSCGLRDSTRRARPASARRRAHP